VRFRALGHRSGFGLGVHRTALFNILHRAVEMSDISIETKRHFVSREQRCAPIVGASNYSQPHSQEARVGRLVPIVIVTAIDIFYRLGDLVGVLPDIVQRGDGHCVELTSG
jgi:hypothetical protein